MNLESPLPEKCQHAIHNLLKIGDVVEDVRVDPVIRAACAPILAGQCNAAIVEADRVYGCLIGARRSPSMPDECKYRLFELEFIVSRDITLDKNLFQACARDAEILCHFSTGSWRKHAMAPCREAVINYAKDIEEEPDLDQRIATACVAAEDRFCSGVRQSVHNQLASVEVPAADREAFLAEAQTSLRDAMFRCLVEHKNHPRMEPQCRSAVEHFQIITLNDVRISPGFYLDCQQAIKLYCEPPPDPAANMKPVPQSKMEVVACLSRKLLEFSLLPAAQENGSSSTIPPRCMRHLRFELLSRAESIHLDPELDAACHSDWKRYCGHVESGQGEVAPGNGRRMKCLLAALDDPSLSDQVDAKCRRSLTLRQDLWAISAKLSGTADWRKLAAELNASTSRNLIFAVALAVIGLIFIFGLLCGRAEKSTWSKWAFRSQIVENFLERRHNDELQGVLPPLGKHPLTLYHNYFSSSSSSAAGITGGNPEDLPNQP
nr:unnamed protein product [Spirometra erinaceieuropaei]